MHMHRPSSVHDGASSCRLSCFARQLFVLRTYSTFYPTTLTSPRVGRRLATRVFGLDFATLAVLIAPVPVSLTMCRARVSGDLEATRANLFFERVSALAENGSQVSDPGRISKRVTSYRVDAPVHEVEASMLRSLTAKLTPQDAADCLVRMVVVSALFVCCGDRAGELIAMAARDRGVEAGGDDVVGGDGAAGVTTRQGRKSRTSATESRKAQDTLWDAFKNTRSLAPSSDLKVFLTTAIEEFIVVDQRSKRDDRKLATAVDSLENACANLRKDEDPDLRNVVREVIAAVPARSVSSGVVDNRVSGVPKTPTRPPSAAPQPTGDHESDAEEPWEVQQAMLWRLYWAVVGGERVDVMCDGNKSAGAGALRIDGIVMRSKVQLSQGGITPNLVARTGAALTEIKRTLGKTSGPHPPGKALGSGGVEPLDPLKGLTHAANQCVGRIGQCILEVLKGECPESRTAFMYKIKDMFPLALGIADSNTNGAVFARLDPDWESHGGVNLKFPLIIEVAAISQLESGRSKTMRPPHTINQVHAMILSLLPFHVCDNARTGIDVEYKGYHAGGRLQLDFSADRDEGGGDAGGTQGQSPPDQGGDKGRGGGSGSPEEKGDDGGGGSSSGSTAGTGFTGTMYGIVVQDLTSDRGVFVLRITAVTPPARGEVPRGLRPGVCVVVKRNLAPRELEIWRVLDGCVGVPRVYPASESGYTVAVTPEGAHSHTLRDWFGGGGHGRLQAGRCQRKEFAQAIVTQLHDVVRRMHDRHVVHADLHPGNVVLVTDRATGSVLPIVIDFGHAVLVRDGEIHETTPLTHLEATLSVRGTLLARKGADRPQSWRPQYTDDLESIVLLGEWLVGNMPDGDLTTAEVKRDLLAKGRAFERWGIDLSHLDTGNMPRAKAMPSTRPPLRSLNV